ncbi:MAG TPA: hypothetical protein H9968_06120, partial [Candidatus Anaerobutyricum stercoris]|nr:hypothetical protein [Candidatus Anaerobutyricum stercoris]
LSNVKRSALPSKTSKDLYTSMSETAFPAAAEELKASGEASYNAYRYEEALKDLEPAYEYSDNDYETLYMIAMCYKNTGEEEKANEYFYEVINESGDNDLIRRASNLGLGVLVNAGKEAAAEYAEKNGKGNNDESSNNDSNSSDNNSEDSNNSRDNSDEAEEETTEDEESGSSRSTRNSNNDEEE